MSLTDGALVLARLALSGLFLLAGISKLLDRRGFQQAFVNLGGPPALASTAAVTLPLAEIAIALLLVPSGAAVWSASAALLLLAIFTAAISTALVRGRAADCHCFGELSKGPLGTSTLVRNMALMALAAWIVIAAARAPDPGIVALWQALTVPGRMAMAIAAALYGMFAARIVPKKQARTSIPSVRLTPGEAPVAGGPGPLAIGERAPAFELQNIHGASVSLRDLLTRGKPVVLVSLNLTCGPCRALLPDIERWQRDDESGVTVVMISKGPVDWVKTRLTHAIGDVLIQPKREIRSAYRLSGSPSAIIIEPDGSIGSLPVSGPDAVRQLIEATRRGVNEARS